MFNLFWRPYVPGFRVRPHDDVPGFNIDQNGLPRRASVGSDGMLRDAMTKRYPDAAQTEVPHSMSVATPGSEAMIQSAPSIGLAGLRVSPQDYVPGFNVGPGDDVPDFDLGNDVEEEEENWSSQTPSPSTEEPVQPASPQFPEWVYRLVTMLPQLLTPSNPLTVGQVAINSPLTLPSTEPAVAKRWPSSEVPQSAEVNAHARAVTTQSTDPQLIARSSMLRAWPQPQNGGGPYAQLTRLYTPLTTGIARRPIGLSPILEARPVEGSNFTLANAAGASEPQTQRQTPLLQHHQKQLTSSPGTVTPVSDGPSLGQKLLQSSVDTVVPGAYYQRLAREQLGAGNYIGAGVYQGAALLDAALGVATFGLSTRLAAGVRAATAEGAALFRRVFGSRSQLLRYLGPAPKGMQWHHIVEQSQAAQFGQRRIQSVENVVAIPIEAHQALSAFYSSKQKFSQPKTVREWLQGQSFEAQYAFGMEQLKRVLGY